MSTVEENKNVLSYPLRMAKTLHGVALQLEALGAPLGKVQFALCPTQASWHLWYEAMDFPKSTQRCSGQHCWHCSVSNAFILCTGGSFQCKHVSGSNGQGERGTFQEEGLVHYLTVSVSPFHSLFSKTLSIVGGLWQMFCLPLLFDHYFWFGEKYV